MLVALSYGYTWYRFGLKPTVDIGINRTHAVRLKHDFDLGFSPHQSITFSDAPDHLVCCTMDIMGTDSSQGCLKLVHGFFGSQ
jgi:hypothetical protein